ncbi:hypothetical protein FOQG_19506 [Fusarium oxysporum f. sp. raphani 54005]|uniref:non-specific serine/threonine protein kinase n=1 Tax=Fusarium oxysporum f. sp. raphani 54005 TaxID=1089458 RepID=X0BB85_FUSOX|nr:hypothetical protein FOQG_19506 [Fusarium oxysporum f. sp. raphani 54005]
MALGSPGERRENSQEERLKAMENLKTWTEDFESTLRSIPENERSASSDYSPAYEPTTYKGVDRSPALPRKRTRRTAVCQIGEGSLRKNDRQEPSDDESAPRPPDTPTPTGRNTGQGTRRSQRLALRPRGGGGEQGRQYCTQKCLLGMVKGGFLDPKCPNVALHCKSCVPARARHPVNHEEWLRLLWKQLKQSLDDGIRPLGEGGARGVLFQVTLLTHGYTFVSKGTVRAFIKDLEHEAAVYKRLKPIQGVNVPVFLGAVDLRSMNKTYYYDHRVYVVHMTFLSWGGCSIDRAQRIGDMDRSLEDEAIRSLRAMHREGVIHKDVRLANMLFNPETNGVMMIDFERALLLKPPRRPLAPLVPNKRAWKSETMDAKKVTGDSSKRSRPSQSFSEDICYKIIQEYDRHRQKVIEVLRNSHGTLHISFDGWTSRNKLALYGIACFFRDEKNRPCKIMIEVPEAHRHFGSTIGGEVLDVLHALGVSPEKIGYFALDNAENNDTAMEVIGAELGFDGRLRRGRCIGHIINLSAKALLFGKTPTRSSSNYQAQKRYLILNTLDGAKRDQLASYTTS